MRMQLAILLPMLALLACSPPPPELDIVERGRQMFFNETFDGNGRTCGTCHRADNNLTIDPSFIATLPDDDPLFVAEFIPELRENFENPKLMREFGLILENQDGFDDLANNFNMRGVPHTLALSTSIASRAGPRTGWSGDGSPGDGSLRSFATGAVIQHFTKTLNRVAAVDFRLPTDEELDALEAFQLSLGRQEELTLPLMLRNAVASRGQEIFLDRTSGKCNACHFNAGANVDPTIFGADAGNLSFNTGVEDLPDQPADLSGEQNPPDDGFGTPGNGEFNVPPVVEVADTPPFFHNNSVATIEGTVVFYNSDAFNNSPAGQVLAGATGGGISLEVTQVEAVAVFLRVINALENIRDSEGFLNRTKELTSAQKAESDRLLARAIDETDDAIIVLDAVAIHSAAVASLREAKRLTENGLEKRSSRAKLVDEAISQLQMARADMEGPPATSEKR